VAQRIRKCSNPDMVIDLARSSVLVALFWAAGRGADGAGMSVKGHRHSTPTLHGWRPVQPAEPAYPPFLSTGQAGDALPSLHLSVDIDKSKRLDTLLWVPAISVAGPLPVPWVEQWAINRLGKDSTSSHHPNSGAPGLLVSSSTPNIGWAKRSLRGQRAIKSHLSTSGSLSLGAL
jgi:hypothetical protein